MSLKTLHLTNAWHATSGGIGTFYRSLLHAANDSGHHLRLIVPSEYDGVEDVGSFGRIYHLRSARAPLNRRYRFLYPPQYLHPHGKICEILNGEQPDLIEICDKYTLPYLGGLLRVGKLNGVPFRVPIVGLSCERMDENMRAYLNGSRFGQWFCRWYMKNIYFPQSDYHVANSPHTAEELREASRGHKVQRGVWIRPMGVDAARFSPALRSAEYRRTLAIRAGGSEASSLLLYVGRLVPEKNLALLVDTMAELASRAGVDRRLLIAGGGMSENIFRQTCEERIPGRVLFLDHIADRGELARLYASCDVFVHPNPREPFGIAPLEAMASGLPLVAPDAGGVTFYANTGNAWLAHPDPVSFASAIEEVGRDSIARRAKVQNAVQTAARYEWKAVAADFLKLYRDLADSHHQGRQPEQRPQFYSTLGDYLGREITESRSGRLHAFFTARKRD